MDTHVVRILFVPIVRPSNPSPCFSPRWLLLGLPLIGASLAWQGWQLQRLSQLNNDVVAPTAQATRLAVTSSAQTLALFGQPNAPRAVASSLNLRLQASFLRRPAEQSSALIASAGQPARRLQVGALIQPGVRLVSIQARQVELEVHGQRQRLGLYRTPAQTLATAGYP